MSTHGAGLVVFVGSNRGVLRSTRHERQRIACLLNYVALTVYKIDQSDVDGEPKAHFKCLKELVGERGFEPPTPWSRTRFQDLLKSIEFYCFQVIAVE